MDAIGLSHKAVGRNARRAAKSGSAFADLVQLGAIGAALTVSLRSGGILLSLLVLPLYVPVLVFGAGVVSYAAKGLPVSGVLALLGAMMLASFTLAPAAVAAGLRISSGN